MCVNTKVQLVTDIGESWSKCVIDHIGSEGENNGSVSMPFSITGSMEDPALLHPGRGVGSTIQHQTEWMIRMVSEIPP